MSAWPIPPTPRVWLTWRGRGALHARQGRSDEAPSADPAQHGSSRSPPSTSFEEDLDPALAPGAVLRRVAQVLGTPRPGELFDLLSLVDEIAEPGAASSLLIQGDNLEAARILARTHAGAVALLYLDPPFNIRTNTAHYDDAQDRVAWLNGIAARLHAFRALLREDAVVVAQIDKREQATLRMLLDDALGASTFVCTIAVRMSATSGYKIEHTDRTIVKNVEFLHVYSPALRLRGRVYDPSEYDSHYSLILQEGDDGTRWGQLCSEDGVRELFAQEALSPSASNLPELYRRSASFRDLVVVLRDRICRTHTAPARAREELAQGDLVFPDDDRFTVVTKDYGGQLYHLRRTRTAVDQLIPIASKLRNVDRVSGPDEKRLTTIAGDFWDGFHLDMGNVDTEAGGNFKHGKKPERLLRRIIELFSDPGDLVMDPYSGTGTTAAVACKLGRRFIAIEQGEQALTHALPRLEQVVRGDDPGGITRAVNFRGGGSFDVCRLEDGASDRESD